MNMQDVQGDQSWKTQPFRQKVIQQIEEAVRQSGNPTSKTSIEMENHVYTKARTKEEYLGLVARLIIHVREISNSKKERSVGPGMGGPNQMVGLTGQGSQGLGISSSPGIPDPINALQNLARQGTTVSNNMPNVQQIQVSGPGQQLHPSSVMGQGMIRGPSQHHPSMNPNMSAMQGPPQQQLQFPVNNTGVVSTFQQHSVPPNSQFVTSMGQQQSAIPEAMPSSMQLQLQKIRAQQQQQQQQQQGMRPMNQMPPNAQFGGPSPVNDVMMVQSQQQSPVGLPRQSTPGPFPGHSPGGLMVSSQGPMSNQHMVMSSTGNLQPMQHPSLVPSPSNQMRASPVSQMGAIGPRHMMGMGPVHSPSSSLNTPAGPGMSPVAHPHSVDQAYMDKLKSLQKYVEPLTRMINRIDKEEADKNKKDLSRMRNLLEILLNPNKRVSIETLLKCEGVLEKMDLNVKVGDAITLSPAPIPTLPGSRPQEQNMCQLLLDAVAHHIKYPTFNHTLQRTFGPGITALHGPGITSDVGIESKDEELIAIEDGIPNLVQGEIARLDRRFKVSLDQIQHAGSKMINLICQLDDKNLPCVPPISISVPEKYPQTAPKFDSGLDEYSSTPFLKSIQRSINLQLDNLPNKYSITSLLNTWEMSVRQACSPNCVAMQLAY